MRYREPGFKQLDISAGHLRNEAALFAHRIRKRDDRHAHFCLRSVLKEDSAQLMKTSMVSEEICELQKNVSL